MNEETAKALLAEQKKTNELLQVIVSNQEQSEKQPDIIIGGKKWT